MVRGRVEKPLGQKALWTVQKRRRGLFRNVRKALFNIGRIGVKQSGWADLHWSWGGKSCRQAEKAAVSGLP
jgi:hypothetical protein